MKRDVEPIILHLDAAILVVDKPAGVLSVPGRGGDPCVGDLLRGRDNIPADEPFRSVHRLDRDASGVLVFARSLSAQRRLTESFAARQVEKIYLAIVQGRVRSDGQVELAIREDRNRGRAMIDQVNGKPSLTAYRVAERLAGHTLLECRPHTGRLHQIRVHLAAVEYPLAVDPIYGGKKPIYLSQFKTDYRPGKQHEERPLIDRLTLHAQRITFPHPVSEAPVSFESPPPKDFRATVNQLRRLYERESG